MKAPGTVVACQTSAPGRFLESACGHERAMNSKAEWSGGGDLTLAGINFACRACSLWRPKVPSLASVLGRPHPVGLRAPLRAVSSCDPSDFRQ